MSPPGVRKRRERRVQAGEQQRQHDDVARVQSPCERSSRRAVDQCERQGRDQCQGRDESERTWRCGCRCPGRGPPARRTRGIPRPGRPNSFTAWRRARRSARSSGCPWWRRAGRLLVPQIGQLEPIRRAGIRNIRHQDHGERLSQADYLFEHHRKRQAVPRRRRPRRRSVSAKADCAPMTSLFSGARGPRSGLVKNAIGSLDVVEDPSGATGCTCIRLRRSWGGQSSAVDAGPIPASATCRWLTQRTASQITVEAFAWG